MSDPLIARFAAACGAAAPLTLRVELAGGDVLAEGAVDQPFALVGRDEACDVTLSDADVNPRHAWLQVLGGRVFAADLGSRTGVAWPGRGRGPGWLDPGAAAQLGPFLLRLTAPAGGSAAAPPADPNPLAADPASRGWPPVTLEFRNGKRARDRWAVNRRLTLIGRSPECKIHLTADDIAAFHCGLVSTRDGLWVVDLSGHGVVVNGERMRVAPLPHGAELWVGRFLIGCHAPPGPAARGATPADEVELGAALDPAADLPASHIMADAFRPPDAAGPASGAIQVAGAAPPPAADESLAALLGTLGLDPGADADPAAVARQMAELHDRTGQAFARWLALVPRLIARVPAEHLAAVRHELERIEELTAAIAAAQAELTRRAVERAVADRDRPAGEAAPPAPVLDTPGPVRVDARTPPPRDDRLTALHQERANRWAAVVAVFVAVGG